MSTRSLNRIETSTNDSSFYYLNKMLELAGVFLFINGIYVAFFSDSLVTTFGYYFVVIAAVCLLLARVISPESPLISHELQSTIRNQLSRTGTKTGRDRRSSRRRTSRRSGFDVRRYLRGIVKKVQQIDFGRFVSRRNGRDRL
ncbi:hypothetical protein SAMN05421858_1425 [Haladaptatus litoreus]|uniref:Uncharacterized protein n=1 Tax=Haladaptatus litoreus TaxID=553468 RepID=A0A1N6Y6A6_9EURY|nr:hypothetical protein [Haladaptatus litoreus]SIR10175.1 hypothetical protein SAMN05421858_1425 [Haladaptatus litoreus]